jgi:hypothetical protein
MSTIDVDVEVYQITLYRISPSALSLSTASVSLIFGVGLDRKPASPASSGDK